MSYSSRTSRPPSAPRPVRLLVLVPLLAVLALTGCAQREDDSPGNAQADAGFPVELEPANAPSVTLDQRPDRIVSLVPSVTETLYEVGAGEQVVAVDDQSTHPKKAPQTELSGLDPDPQAIAGHNPDLVIVNADTEGKLTTALDKTGTPTLVLPAPTTLDEAYEQFELVGKATGHADEGKQLANDVEKQLTRLAKNTRDKGLSYYHELDPSYYTATSATFVGEIYDLFGLRNVADQGNPNAMGGYPQLTAEKIIEADPDLIFLADTKCCGQSPRTVAGRAGWDTLTAVKRDQVVGLDDDVASRWSPRLVELGKDIAEAVSKA